MNATEENWLNRLAPGSPCQAEAIRELGDILKRGLAAGLSVRRKTDGAFIEDMVQIALVRILDRIDSFNGHSRFTTWAMTITIRIAYNELRRRDWNNLSLDALKEDGHLPEQTEDSMTDPAETASRQDFKLHLRQLIQEHLTPRQRDVLIAELNGMPQEEIVRQLGGTRNSIYKLFHDARKNLKHALEREGIFAFDQLVQLGSRQRKGSS